MGLFSGNFALAFRTWLTNANVPPRFDFLHTGNIQMFFFLKHQENHPLWQDGLKKHLRYFWFKVLS